MFYLCSQALAKGLSHQLYHVPCITCALYHVPCALYHVPCALYHVPCTTCPFSGSPLMSVSGVLDLVCSVDDIPLSHGLIPSTMILIILPLPLLHRWFSKSSRCSQMLLISLYGQRMCYFMYLFFIVAYNFVFSLVTLSIAVSHFGCPW